MRNQQHKDREYFFYRLPPSEQEFNLKIEAENYMDYKLEKFTPSLVRIIPSNLKKVIFIAFWILYFPKILRGYRESYSIFILYPKNSNKPIHQTVVLSKIFKFPFMKEKDLHIGPIYTDPSFRQRGITRFIINNIIQEYGINRSYWWVTRELDVVSQMVAEKLGFTLIGYGKKERKFLINRYNIEKFIGRENEYLL